VPVTLTVVAVPKPVVNAIANAGSYSTGAVSPGENIVIFGAGIGPADLVKGAINGGVFATTAGNTRVLFDGVPAPVLYASDKQTSVMVPYGISGRTTTSVQVEYLGVQSVAIGYNVALAAPGIYTLNQAGNGPGATLNQDGFTVNAMGARSDGQISNNAQDVSYEWDGIWNARARIELPAHWRSASWSPRPTPSTRVTS
jgi:hypothetical protein